MNKTRKPYRVTVYFFFLILENMSFLFIYILLFINITILFNNLLTSSKAFYSFILNYKIVSVSCQRN